MKAKRVKVLSWSHPAISSCLVYLGSHAMHSYFIHESSYKNKTSETAIKLKKKKKKKYFKASLIENKLISCWTCKM